MSDDRYIESLKEVGRSLAQNGGLPPTYADAANNPKASVIRTAYEAEKQKQK